MKELSYPTFWHTKDVSKFDTRIPRTSIGNPLKLCNPMSAATHSHNAIPVGVSISVAESDRDYH